MKFITKMKRLVPVAAILRASPPRAVRPAAPGAGPAYAPAHPKSHPGSLFVARCNVIGLTPAKIVDRQGRPPGIEIRGRRSPGRARFRRGSGQSNRVLRKNRSSSARTRRPASSDVVALIAGSGCRSPHPKCRSTSRNPSPGQPPRIAQVVFIDDPAPVGADQRAALRNKFAQPLRHARFEHIQHGCDQQLVTG